MKDEHMQNKAVDGMEELLNEVASELMEAIEKKDKKLLIDALTALVLHIQDMDKQQDEMDGE